MVVIIRITGSNGALQRNLYEGNGNHLSPEEGLLWATISIISISKKQLVGFI